MKNLMVISTLCLLVTACAAPGPASVPKSALLEFADLADEITVNHEADDTTAIVFEPSDNNATD